MVVKKITINIVILISHVQLGGYAQLGSPARPSSYAFVQVTLQASGVKITPKDGSPCH